MRIDVKRLLWLTVIIIAAIVVRAGLEFSFDLYQTQYSLTQIWTLTIRFLVLGFVILVWLGIVISSDTTENKLPWLMILAIEPFIGIALFLTFGRNFRRSERYRELPLLRDGQYLSKEPLMHFEREGYMAIDSEVTDIYKAGFNSTKHHAYLDDTRAQVLTNGVEKFPVLIEELKKAENFILMEYYIMRTDDIGKQVLSILKEKAEAGLDVYLMYDAFGGAFLNKKFMNGLKKAGVKIVINDPVYFGLFNTRINYRNHRKITVIDGKVGILGGINLGDEYLDKKKKRFGKWRDTSILLEGNAVRSMTQLFFRDWYYNTDTFISDDKYYKKHTVESKGLVQIIPNGPDFKHPPIRNVYVKMINNAKKSIKIMTPYIALDQELMTSLVIAAKSGVKVDIIIPGIPDKRTIYTVTNSFIEDLLEEGIHVHKYVPGFCHGKVFIIDDMLASCGSYNLDNRSARINFEVTALLFNEAVDVLVKDFDNDLKVSREILVAQWKKRSIIRRLYEGIFNLFSPLV